MTPTPRTNAAIMTGYFGESSPVVSADFARELERENAELREVISLLTSGWIAHPVSLYDEEGVEGWCWESPGGEELNVIGLWSEPPPLADGMKPQAARSALGEPGSAPEPLPGQKNASTGRTGAREGR